MDLRFRWKRIRLKLNYLIIGEFHALHLFHLIEVDV